MYHKLHAALGSDWDSRWVLIDSASTHVEHLELVGPVAGQPTFKGKEALHLQYGRAASIQVSIVCSLWPKQWHQDLRRAL